MLRLQKDYSFTGDTMKMVIQSTIDYRDKRRVAHYPSELDFLRALDRIEERAAAKNLDVYRFDTSLRVEGRNGTLVFSETIGD